MATFPFSPVIVAAVLFAGGVVAGGYLARNDDQPAAAPQTDQAPAQGSLDSLIVPVWEHGRIAAFVAVDLKVDFKPGTSINGTMPLVRDRLLTDLYAWGAKGLLRPERIEPAKLKAELMRASNEASDGAVLDLTLNKMIHQENRRG